MGGYETQQMKHGTAVQEVGAALNPSAAKIRCLDRVKYLLAFSGRLCVMKESKRGVEGLESGTPLAF